MKEKKEKKLHWTQVRSPAPQPSNHPWRAKDKITFNNNFNHLLSEEIFVQTKATKSHCLTIKKFNHHISLNDLETRRLYKIIKEYLGRK